MIGKRWLLLSFCYKSMEVLMKYFKLTLIILFFAFLLTNCGENTAPAIPDSPVGPVVGVPGFPSIFRASTTDRNNDNISYQFDWGDGTASAWTPFIPSGDTIYWGRLYLQKGIYEVRVHAQDQRDEMSGWSSPLSLIVGFPDTTVVGIGTGNNPADIEILPNGNLIYVTNFDDGNVSVISSPDHLVLGSIEVGNNPIGILALPNGQYLYAMVNGENYVLSLPVSGGRKDTIPVPSPCFAAVLSSGQYVYVTSSSTGNVYVIQTSNNTVVDTIPVDTIAVGFVARTITALPDGENIYVSRPPDKLYKIRTSDNTIIDSIPIAATDMAASSDGQYLYICANDGFVYVLRTSDNSPIAEIEVGGNAFGLCLHHTGLLLYVTDISNSTVSVIYTPNNKVIKKDIPVYYAPAYIASSPSGEYMYVLGADYVSVIGISQ
jgi:YVTN family beta-propeller protein